MLDFDTIMMKHSEAFLFEIVEQWERRNGIASSRPMLLEERWNRFIETTNDNRAPEHAAVA